MNALIPAGFPGRLLISMLSKPSMAWNARRILITALHRHDLTLGSNIACRLPLLGIGGDGSVSLSSEALCMLPELLRRKLCNEKKHDQFGSESELCIPSKAYCVWPLHLSCPENFGGSLR